MDAGYDALEAAASSYTKTRERGDDDGRSHRSHRERDHDRGHDRERERDGDRDRERERRHRDRGGDEREDRHRERERGDRGDRARDRGGDSYRGGGGGGDSYRGDRDRERYDRERPREFEERPRRRRREDDDSGLAAEPMGGGGGGGGHRDRRPRYDDGGFAQPMRGYSPPRNGGGGGGRRGYDDRDRDRDRDRGGRRDRDRGGGRFFSPGRSPTPPNAVPIEERHVEHSHWDERPPQFTGIGAMEAKMTGMFTYGPGRVPPPLHLGVPPALMAGSFPPSNPVRQTKRLYVGGINDQMSEAFIQDFFNKLMHEHKLAVDMPGDPVAYCQINNDKNFAFVEFRTSEEATAALQFDGVMCEGQPFRVRRPKDYMGVDPVSHSFGAPGHVDSPNKLFVGGLPTYLNDDQVMELLKSFGELKTFNLVKEGAGVSKGFAFCEYLDSTVTDMAIQGLNGFALGDRNLVVQRAAVGRNTGAPNAMPGSAGYLHQAAPNILQSANSSSDEPTSRCMLLLNMVTPDELISDEDYSDILEDINEECGKYGSVEGVRIPRPTPKSKKWEPTDSATATAEKNRKADEENGVGRVYVLYKDLQGVKNGMRNIGGRQFAGRTILVANVPEEEFLGPAPPPPPPETENAEEPAAPAPAEPEEPEDLDAAAENALKDIMAGL